MAASVDSPRAARQFCRLELSAAIANSAAAADAIEDAELLVSELVTDAFELGALTIGTELELHRAYLRIIVTDDAPGRPPAVVGGQPVRSNALYVVNQTAQHWGTNVTPAGVQAWAMIPIPRRATAGLPCTVTNLFWREPT